MFGPRHVGAGSDTDIGTSPDPPLRGDGQRPPRIILVGAEGFEPPTLAL